MKQKDVAMPALKHSSLLLISIASTHFCCQFRHAAQKAAEPGRYSEVANLAFASGLPFTILRHLRDHSVSGIMVMK